MSNDTAACLLSSSKLSGFSTRPCPDSGGNIEHHIEQFTFGYLIQCLKEAPAPESRSGFQMQPVRVKSSILHSSSFVSSGLGLIFMEVHEFCPSEKRHTQASHSHQRANRGHGGSQGFSPPCSPPDDDPPCFPLLLSAQSLLGLERHSQRKHWSSGS